jgi:hypothetical protein
MAARLSADLVGTVRMLDRAFARFLSPRPDAWDEAVIRHASDGGVSSVGADFPEKDKRRCSDVVRRFRAKVVLVPRMVGRVVVG